MMNENFCFDDLLKNYTQEDTGDIYDLTGRKMITPK